MNSSKVKLSDDYYDENVKEINISLIECRDQMNKNFNPKEKLFGDVEINSDSIIQMKQSLRKTEQILRLHKMKKSVKKENNLSFYENDNDDVNNQH